MHITTPTEGMVNENSQCSPWNANQGTLFIYVLLCHRDSAFCTTAWKRHIHTILTLGQGGICYICQGYTQPVEMSILLVRSALLLVYVGEPRDRALYGTMQASNKRHNGCYGGKSHTEVVKIQCSCFKQHIIPLTLSAAMPFGKPWTISTISLQEKPCAKWRVLEGVVMFVYSQLNIFLPIPNKRASC